MVVRLVVLVILVSLGVKAEECEVQNQWGGDPCNLPGGLAVESLPNHHSVTGEKCNSFYPKDEFKNQPTISYSGGRKGEKYTVVMVDPDAPNHPEGKYYLHWIISNIPGDDLQDGNLKAGTVLSQYRGPTPPDGTGTHRYLLLLYRQDPTASLTLGLPDSRRSQFDLGAWSNGLCGPLSGVQFRTNFSGKEE
uniref:Phosphatidylethanolamine-binding protein n=1 Tax=Homalodisca liturata TaxID=320908 RepID=A0A1B6JCU3_9HEMI